MPRPTYQAPPGRLTLADAAKCLGISYHVAYTRLTTLGVEHERDGNIYTIAEEDLGELDRQKVEPKDKRVAVAVRVARDRHKAWERAAGDKAVSTWLAELGDQAAGYRTPQDDQEQQPTPRARKRAR